MHTRPSPVLLAFLFLTACGPGEPRDSSTTTGTSEPELPPQLAQVVGGLNNPIGLSARNGRLLVTDGGAAFDPYASTGGAPAQLIEIDASSGLKTPRLSDPPAWWTVAELPEGSVALAGFVDSAPGDQGELYLLPEASGTATLSATLPAAIMDMRLLASDDLWLVGYMPPYTPGRALIRVPGPAYDQWVVEVSDLPMTRSAATDGETWYLQTLLDTVDGESEPFYRWTSAGGTEPWTVHWPDPDAAPLITAMEVVGDQLYFADYEGGTVGRIDLATGVPEILFEDLDHPNTLRYDPSNERLFLTVMGGLDSTVLDGAVFEILNIRTSR